MTRSTAKSLVGLVDDVRVSLDAMRVRNDSLRGEGNFDAALRALDHFYEVGFEPKVLITVTSESLPDLEELVTFLIRRNISRFNVNGFRPIGRGEGQWKWRIDSSQIETVLRRAWERADVQQPFPASSSVEQQQSHCGVGQFLNVMPNGDVFPCHVLTGREFRCGNVLEQSLLDICRKSTLLGQLADLNFVDLAEQDSDLQELTRPNTCMGNVYAETRTAAAWRNSLPMLNILQ